MNKFVGVEQVLNINDNRLWYYIPGFNGYEISNDNFIRSMKHFKKYPYGILIRAKRDINGNIIHPENPIYELSNNNNKRISLHLSDIINLAQTNQQIVQGYPRRTYQTDISSRNQRCTIQRDIVNNKEVRHVKFTINKI